ncbi:Hsp20/alpha crystallin family protein [Aegicerativicinus sediminis]|uniref:Hsp20/alpha crystallin family protein n=1 Tax=Aegicerativicinus sediminis TaxID=2893202 RepID=UPI001E3C1017|nr:Hsp20/alpha crystallin family protein [Aegicerativicinus sediminis]
MSTVLTVPKNGQKESRDRGISTLPRFSSWFDNFFDNDLGTGFLSNFNTGMTLPAVNIKEDAEQFTLEIAVPGMKKSDFNVDVDNKILSISSETQSEKSEKEENYTRREFGYSSFKRTFTLPDSVNSDKIKAIYKEGILSVILPKKEEAKEKPAKRIEIS